MMNDYRLRRSLSNLESRANFLQEPTPVRGTRRISAGNDVYVSSEYDYVMKVILLGDQGVGKTSFMKALRVHPDVPKVQCQCSCSVTPTSDHIEIVVSTGHGKRALIRLFDTGGQERYRSLTSSYYRGAHGVLLMFDMRNQKSMENIETWISDLDTFCTPTSGIRIILGSNCAAKDRKVTSLTARKYADNRSLPFMEFDTSHFYNVVESLQLVVDRVAKEVTVSPQNSTIIRPCMSSENLNEPQDDAQLACVC